MSNIKRSRFLIPYKNTGKKHGRPSEDWGDIKFKSHYLNENISMLFRQQEDAVCKFYKLKKESYSKFGLANGELYLSVNKKAAPVKLKISQIFEAEFITGTNILVLELEFESEEKLSNIANVGFAMTHLELRNDVEIDRTMYSNTKNTNSNIKFMQQSDTNEEKEEIVFSGIIKKIIIGDRKREDIKISGRTIAYHNLVVERECSIDNCMLFFLRRGRKYIENNESDCYFDECEFKKCASASCPVVFEPDIEFNYENSTNIVLSGCSNGVVSLAKDSSFAKDAHSKSISNSYFLIFLYVVHEREVLLEYCTEIVGSYNDEKKMFALKDQMMRFNVLFGFNMVSQEMAYQKFYENLYKVFRLQMLEKETQEILGKLTDFQEKKRKSRTSKLLGVLTVASLLSAAKVIAEFYINIEELGIINPYNGAAERY